MKISEAEWAVLDVLWSGDKFSLGEVTNALMPVKKWSRNTVHTYLTRMERKGLVHIDKSSTVPYSAAVLRETCAKDERKELLEKVYGGSAGSLISAFLKESKISKSEVEELRKLLDEMEV